MFRTVRETGMGRPVLFVSALTAMLVAAMIYSFWPATALSATPQTAHATVLSMRAWHDVPEVASPAVKYDVLAVKIANRSHSPNVKFSLLTCAHAAMEGADVRAVSDTPRFLKRTSEWSFRLRPGATKTVIFRIKGFGVPYCAARVNYIVTKFGGNYYSVITAQSN
jgi:hypothetical protein